MHSVAAFAMAQYSASVLNRDTVGCRFEDHETSESPRKTQNRKVERRVLGQPA
jgi:hypothetical protein